VIFCFSLFSRIPLNISGFNLCLHNVLKLEEMEGEGVKGKDDNL